MWDARQSPQTTSGRRGSTKNKTALKKLSNAESFQGMGWCCLDCGLALSVYQIEATDHGRVSVTRGLRKEKKQRAVHCFWGRLFLERLWGLSGLLCEQRAKNGEGRREPERKHNIELFICLPAFDFLVYEFTGSMTNRPFWLRASLLQSLASGFTSLGFLRAWVRALML